MACNLGVQGSAGGKEERGSVVCCWGGEDDDVHITVWRGEGAWGGHTPVWRADSSGECVVSIGNEKKY